MKCTKCGFENIVKASYCNKCGTKFSDGEKKKRIKKQYMEK